ncbi:hypothetical protein D3C80_1170740 [compost metagenome]
MAVRQMPREIVRAEDCQHAVRTVAQRRGTIGHIGMLFAGASMIGLNRNSDFIDHRRDFGRRFPARLAGFAGNNAGQLCLIRFQQRREFFDDRLTRRKRQFCPRREGFSGRLRRLRYLSRTRIKPLPERLVAYRIGLNASFTFARDPVTIDP